MLLRLTFMVCPGWDGVIGDGFAHRDEGRRRPVMSGARWPLVMGGMDRGSRSARHVTSRFQGRS